MNLSIFLTDSFSQKKKELKISKPVTLYVCGITPYDYPHIGHGRCYIVYDVLYRFLKYLEIDVVYCRNITDIEDKLIKKAEDLYSDGSKYLDVANFYFEAFCKDLEALNCLVPDFQPKVTKYMDQIISMVDVLIKKGHAYETEDGIYFDTKSFKHYCALSKREADALSSGARIKVDESKRNSYDFALWKRSDKKPYFSSPFGNGRPGWHIECSAMSYSVLGSSVSIHGGGMDLIFPHHENELAQSVCFDSSVNVDIWMHCAFINKDNQKMSKSLNNFVYLKEYLKQYNPMVFRYAMVVHHYTHPINFSDDFILHAEKEYKKLCLIFSDFSEQLDLVFSTLNTLYEQLLRCLYEDLNIQKMIGLIFSNQSIIKQNKELKNKIKSLIINVLGLTLENFKEESMYNDKIKELIEAREEARKKRDFKEADQIRDELKKLGYNVQDEKFNK